MSRSPSHTLWNKSLQDLYAKGEVVCTLAWVSFDPELLAQTIAEAKERRAIVLSYLYSSVGNNMKMLLRKLSRSPLPGMDVCLGAKGIEARCWRR